MDRAQRRQYHVAGCVDPDASDFVPTGADAPGSSRVEIRRAAGSSRIDQLLCRIYFLRQSVRLGRVVGLSDADSVFVAAVCPVYRLVDSCGPCVRGCLGADPRRSVRVSACAVLGQLDSFCFAD